MSIFRETQTPFRLNPSCKESCWRWHRKSLSRILSWILLLIKLILSLEWFEEPWSGVLLYVFTLLSWRVLKRHWIFLRPLSKRAVWKRHHWWVENHEDRFLTRVRINPVFVPLHLPFREENEVLTPCPRGWDLVAVDEIYPLWMRSSRCGWDLPILDEIKSLWRRSIHCWWDLSIVNEI